MMPDRATLEALARRLEGGETGRQIDWDVAATLQRWKATEHVRIIGETGAPRLTTSLDAAAALVERMLPGWAWGCGWCELEAHAFVMDPTAKTRDGEMFEGLMLGSKNVAAMLMLALLRVLIARGETS